MYTQNVIVWLQKSSTKCLLPLIMVGWLLPVSFVQGADEQHENTATTNSNSVLVGVVDWRYALFQSDAAKKEDVRMQNANKNLIEQAQALEKNLDVQGKRLEKDTAIMSEQDIKVLQQSFNNNLRAYEEVRLQLQEIQAQTEARFLAEQRGNVDSAIQQLAQKYTLDFIVERSAIVYAKKARNITEELIDVLNDVQNASSLDTGN